MPRTFCDPPGGEGGGGCGGRGKQNHKAADNKNVAAAADNKVGIQPDSQTLDSRQSNIIRQKVAADSRQQTAGSRHQTEGSSRTSYNIIYIPPRPCWLDSEQSRSRVRRGISNAANGATHYIIVPAAQQRSKLTRQQLLSNF